MQQHFFGVNFEMELMTLRSYLWHETDWVVWYQRQTHRLLQQTTRERGGLRRDLRAGQLLQRCFRQRGSVHSHVLHDGLSRSKSKTLLFEVFPARGLRVRWLQFYCKGSKLLWPPMEDHIPSLISWTVCIATDCTYILMPCIFTMLLNSANIDPDYTFFLILFSSQWVYYHNCIYSIRHVLDFMFIH